MGILEHRIIIHHHTYLFCCANSPIFGLLPQHLITLVYFLTGKPWKTFPCPSLAWRNRGVPTWEAQFLHSFTHKHTNIHTPPTPTRKEKLISLLRKVTWVLVVYKHNNVFQGFCCWRAEPRSGSDGAQVLSLRLLSATAHVKGTLCSVWALLSLITALFP